ncbi:MAG: glycosyl hydrolase family 17 protein [Fibrobacteria bacterium]
MSRRKSYRLPPTGLTFSYMEKAPPTSAFVSKTLALALPLLFLPPSGAGASAAFANLASARDTNVILQDPRAFKCICYSGYRDGQAPGQSEPTETQVRQDLVLIKRFAHEIRTYGSAKGSHGHRVPKLADELGLNVHLGVWVDATYDDAANQAAVNDAIALVKEGHKSIKSVVVGNEYMLRVRHPEITPTPDIKPDKAASEAKLTAWVKQVKAGMPKGVEVTTADTWAEINADGDELLSQLDFITWHLHPWWEDQDIGNAMTYLESRYNSVTERVARFPGKRIVLGETGWPTQATRGAAVGNPENQMRFFRDLTVWGFSHNAEFWSFTAFDEKWKDAEGTVGGHWGLWFSNRQPGAIITGINALYPKYMWSENPDLASGTRIASPRNALVRTSDAGPRPIDALGRAVEPRWERNGAGRSGHGWTLTPVGSSRGLILMVH